MTAANGADEVERDGVPSIGSSVGRGLRWSITGILATKVASFAMGLVLAHLLAPRDFGIYAVAMAVTAFLIHVNDVGIIAATVQWQGRMEDMAPTATVLAFVFSVAIYAGMWVAAPWLADLASTPSATGVLRLLTAVIVVDGITAVRSAALMRRFQQDRLTKANVIGFAVQMPLAILLAVAHAGAWSFAIAQFTGVVITGIFVLLFAEVPLEIGLDRDVARTLIRFGVPLAAALGVEALLVNADYVIVGRLLGATALGFYLLAFNVSSWVPGVVTTGVRYVSVAGFSRVAEDDSKLRAGVERSLPLLVTAILPITVFTAILSPQLVEVLYGAKWAPSAPVLRFLMILMAGRVLAAFAVDILTSVGATRATFWLNAGWAVVLIPALILATHLDGIRGTAIGHALVATLVALPLSAALLARHGVRLRPVLRAVVRPLLAVGVAGLVCAGVAAALPGPAAVPLLVAGAVGLLVYVLMVVDRAVALRWLGKLRPVEPAAASDVAA